MGKFLSKKQIEELKFAHRVEDKLRYGDRIKTVLLLDAGWSLKKISEALLLDEKTILNYRKLYEEGGVERLCCDNYKGSFSKLSDSQEVELKEHLTKILHGTTAEVISHIKKEYGITYSISGVTDLLHRLGFVYKKTKVVPGKADAEAQKKFLKELEELKQGMKSRDKLYYLDGCHPQYNVIAGRGWIPKGEEKTVKSNTGRKRVNLNGGLDAETLEVIIREDDTINAQSTIALFEMMEKQNQESNTIYAIVDNAKYYKNQLVKEYLFTSKIQLIFLPPYAPNLNLIERLWKFFKKKVLANRYYNSFLEFREACMAFFTKRNLKKLTPELESLLTNNFQIISA